VRRFVVAHQEERPVPGSAPDELDRQVRDHVGDVATAVRRLAGGGVEHGVVVDTLAGQDLPAIEADGIAAQMPLADEPRVVAGGLEQLHHRWLRAVEAVEDGDPVLV
jgi:hypothetical protein